MTNRDLSPGETGQTVDTYIPLEQVRAEAEKVGKMLNAGEGDSDFLYAAYNTLLWVLNYGMQVPSKMWTKDYHGTITPSTGPSGDLREYVARTMFAAREEIHGHWPSDGPFDDLPLQRKDWLLREADAVLSALERHLSAPGREGEKT